jgi:hypothetical protein
VPCKCMHFIGHRITWSPQETTKSESECGAQIDQEAFVRPPRKEEVGTMHNYKSWVSSLRILRVRTVQGKKNARNLRGLPKKLQKIENRVE